MLRRSRPALLLAALALSACTTTQAVRPTDAAAAAQNFMHAHRGGVVTVRLVGGATESARGLRVEPDSASWFDARTGALRRVPTDAVLSVEHLDRQQGAARGAVTGAVTVGVATAVVVFVALRSSDCSPNFFDFCGVGTQAVVSMGTGVAMGSLAVLPGAGVGALVGERDVLRFEPPDTPPGPTARNARHRRHPDG